MANKEMLIKVVEKFVNKVESGRARSVETYRETKEALCADDINILTCVYCGKEYPSGTPSHGSELLTEHIKVCEKHPLRKSEVKVEKLKDVLSALIGTKDKNKLKAMRLAMRDSEASLYDKVIIIDAINVLLNIDKDEEKINGCK